MTFTASRKMQIVMFNEYGREVAKLVSTHITALNHYTWLTELKGVYNHYHYLPDKLTGMNCIDGLITLYYGQRFIEITAAN